MAEKFDFEEFWNRMINNANIGGSAGESLADTAIAYDHYRKIKDTGHKLIRKYGKNTGAGAGIDDYYHPLLQCELAKISPFSRQIGLGLGYAKEWLMDYPANLWKKMPIADIKRDTEKDLKNNAYGSIIGANNPQKSCYELLDDLRTEKMKDENIY